jgi:hypothetical protein
VPERDLESELHALAAQTDVSGAERVTQRTVTRLRNGVTPRARAYRPRLAWAAAALVATLAPVLVWSDARTALADWLGIGGVRISRAPTRSATGPTTTRPPRVVSLGQPTTLAAAGDALGFPMQLPRRADMRVPDAVYLDAAGPGEVFLTYAPGPARPALSRPDVGLLLAEFRGELDGGYFQKVLPPGATVDAVDVAGHPGYWIAGGLHRFFYRAADGTVDAASVRLAGNTLLWTRGDITLRIESALSKADALAIAETVR